ncbi:MAG TPA: uroporphyrinogen decarboxylase family protein [Anaerolineae bacterium]
MPRSRDVTLAILRGERSGRLPVFGGLPSLTAAGLKAAGVRYSESHTDAAKMAAAAASTFELFGFESAVVPFDLCVEAEALGCGIDFQTDVELFLSPVVSEPLVNLAKIRIPQTTRDLRSSEGWSDVLHAGRIPLVAEAIRRLKAGVGREIAIGAWVPGPFTLAWQLFGADGWLSNLEDSERAAQLLELLAGFLAGVAASYHAAGADYVTVHEMGGSSQVTGPNRFQSLVRPALVRLLAAMQMRKVLSVCGDTNVIVRDLAACGADALNVDDRNDLARTRHLLGSSVVLLGNFDPVGVLSQGTPSHIAQVVTQIAQAGANAIWPGCDLYPEIPDENMHALIETARQMKGYE